MAQIARVKVEGYGADAAGLESLFKRFGEVVGLHIAAAEGPETLKPVGASMVAEVIELAGDEASHENGLKGRATYALDISYEHMVLYQDRETLKEMEEIEELMKQAFGTSDFGKPPGSYDLQQAHDRLRALRRSLE